MMITGWLNSKKVHGTHLHVHTHVHMYIVYMCVYNMVIHMYIVYTCTLQTGLEFAHIAVQCHVVHVLYILHLYMYVDV